VGGDFSDNGVTNIQNGSTATISGTLYSRGTLTLDDSNLTVGDLFAEGGTTAIQNGSTVTVTGSLIALGRPFYPYDTFTDLGIDRSTLAVGGDFNNWGSVSTHVRNGSTVMIAGTLNNEPLYEPLNIDQSNLTVGGFYNYGGAIVQNGSTVMIAGSLNNGGGTLTLDNSGLTVGGNFNNGAIAKVQNGSTVAIGGTVFNSGGFNIEGSKVSVSGDFNNDGSAYLDSTSNMTVSGNYTQNQGASLKVNGTLAATIAFINGGTVSGSGIINADVQNIGGTIDVSDPGIPATLAINGDYTQGPNGTLLIDILGTSLGQFSVLDVTGTARLDGTLELDFINGFTAGSFNFLDFRSLVDNFSSIDVEGGLCNGCTVTESIDKTTGEITLDTATPEPASLSLLGTALLGIAALVRRLNAHRA